MEDILAVVIRRSVRCGLRLSRWQVGICWWRHDRSCQGVFEFLCSEYGVLKLKDCLVARVSETGRIDDASCNEVAMV